MIKNVAGAENKLESMVCCLAQKNWRLPFLTLRLENVTDNAKETAAPLMKQVWEFTLYQIEQARRKGLTVGTPANDTKIYGF